MPHHDLSAPEPHATRGPGATADEGSALFEQYAGRVYRLCRATLRSHDDAEDAMQETFLKACRTLERGVAPRSPLAWLLTIARNHCISMLRARREVLSLDAAGELAVPGPALHSELFFLSEALASLPEMQRRALVLREWSGLSYEEIGQELSVSEAAVASHVFRGRNALAQRLTRAERGVPRQRWSWRGRVPA